MYSMCYVYGHCVCVCVCVCGRYSYACTVLVMGTVRIGKGEEVASIISVFFDQVEANGGATSHTVG